MVGQWSMLNCEATSLTNNCIVLVRIALDIDIDNVLIDQVIIYIYLHSDLQHPTICARLVTLWREIQVVKCY